WAVSTTSRLLALGVTVKKTRRPSQSLYHPCQVPERSLRTPAMGVSSIECGNFRIALRLLPFSLETRLLEAVREVLLDGLDGPCITPKQADRRGDIPTFVGPGHRVVADIKQGFQVLRSHDAEEPQPPIYS